MAGTAYSPNAAPGANHKIQAWSKVIHKGIYSKMSFVPLIRQYERLYAALHIRKLGRLTAQTLADATAGTNLTYVVGDDVEVQLTPGAVYCAVAYPRHLRSRVDFSPKSVFTTEVENCMAESIERDVLDNALLVTGAMGAGGDPVSAAYMRTSLAFLKNATRNNEGPGDSNGAIYGIFTTMQYDDISSIPEWMNAEVRGGSDAPHVSGVMLKAHGTTIKFSNEVYTDPGDGTAYNPIFRPDAFGISWNERTSVDYQTEELEDRIIAFADYGSNVVRDEFARVIRSASV